MPVRSKVCGAQKLVQGGCLFTQRMNEAPQRELAGSSQLARTFCNRIEAGACLVALRTKESRNASAYSAGPQ